MKTVLIVDDQPEVRELVKVALSIEDFTMLEATNGDEAVRLARMNRPDLIIMDLMMPGNIDGLQATKLIKGDARLTNCKVIILTARNQKGDEEEFVKSGADDYFFKPFSPLELIDKVDEILEK